MLTDSINVLRDAAFNHSEFLNRESLQLSSNVTHSDFIKSEIANLITETLAESSNGSHISTHSNQVLFNSGSILTTDICLNRDLPLGKLTGINNSLDEALGITK